MLDQAIEKIDEIVGMCIEINNPLLTQTVNEIYPELTRAESVDEILELSKEIRILVEELKDNSFEEEEIILMFQEIDEMIE